MEKYQENNVNKDIFYEEQKRDKIKAAREEVLKKKKEDEEKAKLEAAAIEDKAEGDAEADLWDKRALAHKVVVFAVMAVDVIKRYYRGRWIAPPMLKKREKVYACQLMGLVIYGPCIMGGARIRAMNSALGLCPSRAALICS